MYHICLLLVCRYNIPALEEIAVALPTAELRPIDDKKKGIEDYSQLDEVKTICLHVYMCIFVASTISIDYRETSRYSDSKSIFFVSYRTKWE